MSEDRQWLWKFFSGPDYTKLTDLECETLKDKIIAYGVRQRQKGEDTERMFPRGEGS